MTFSIDRTISVGNLFSVAAMAIGLAITWATMRAELAELQRSQASLRVEVEEARRLDRERSAARSARDDMVLERLTELRAQMAAVQVAIARLESQRGGER